ncbi:chaplin [Streptomyces sp. NPDC049577]|uniref:chaplin n=1 Tax=Streptomyces sp. NPDC049577 TaxID=3155153 RepID=UPI00344A3DC1
MLKKVVAVAAATGGLALAGAGIAAADSGAQGAAVKSPGVVSGNVIQVPVQVPVNLCGNSANVVGLLNPTFGNTCINK